MSLRAGVYRRGQRTDRLVLHRPSDRECNALSRSVRPLRRWGRLQQLTIRARFEPGHYRSSPDRRRESRERSSSDQAHSHRRGTHRGMHDVVRRDHSRLVAATGVRRKLCAGHSSSSNTDRCWVLPVYPPHSGRLPPGGWTTRSHWGGRSGCPRRSGDFRCSARTSVRSRRRQHRIGARCHHKRRIPLVGPAWPSHSGQPNLRSPDDTCALPSA